MLTALYIALGVIGYAVIGNAFGLFFWKSMQKKSRFLPFPLINIDGLDQCNPQNQRFYRYFMAVFWPIELIWSTSVAVFLSLLKLSELIVSGPRKLYKAAKAYLEKRKQRQARVDAELEQVELEGLDELKRLRAEFDRLNEEKKKVYLQIEEIERILEASRRHPFRAS